MGYLILKILITGITVVSVSEIAKRSSVLAAILASLPLTSILAIIWLYVDTQDIQAVKSLSTGIFWMVLPSLFFFLALPLLLRFGMHFYLALAISCVLMSGVYWVFLRTLKSMGIQL